jgi:hypothetical protein
MSDRTQLWASGGGVQSAAIAALIVQGKLRPDLAVIVDTEREQSTTWQYMDTVIAPALQSVGVTLHRVKKSKYATVDVWSSKGDVLLPVFTDQSGEVGKLPTYCSNEWKSRVMQRWATREHGVTAATQWLGISVDEMERMKKDAGNKWHTRYPLIEHRMNRGDCQALVARMGWPQAPRSSCWMCPNHTQVEWRDIRNNKPDDWRKAVQFDKWIRQRDPHAYLHADAVPLDQANLDEINEVLFGHCDTGLCFT